MVPDAVRSRRACRSTAALGAAQRKAPGLAFSGEARLRRRPREPVAADAGERIKGPALAAGGDNGPTGCGAAAIAVLGNVIDQG